MLPAALLLALLGLIALGGCRSVPASQPGPEAEALAQRMLAATGYEAWKKTAAVAWSFNKNRNHLWDRRRDLVQVRWDEVEVIFDKNSMAGKAFEKGRPIDSGEKLRELIQEANGYFVNDAYWLNPLLHLRSPGAQVSRVSPGVLKLHFPSGGVTPGDTYVFHTDDAGLVKEMHLWVSTVPFKGIRAIFQKYETSQTGVKSARLYDFLIDIAIENVVMYEQFPKPGAADPFSRLGK